MRFPFLMITAAAILLFIVLSSDGSDASEVNSDGSVYTYDTYGSGHPDYYCVITSVKSEQKTMYLPSVLEGYDVRILESGAFSSCRMESVVIPANLNEIRDGAFAGCSELKDVYFLGDRPKMNDALPSGVTIHTLPSATGWVGTEPIAVYTSSGVEYVELPGGMVVMGGIPVEGVLMIKGELNGVKVLRIGDYAFSGTMKEDGTVERRTDISNVVIQSGPETIGQRAFYYCDLSEITVPESVRYIQDEAFRSCINLRDAGISEKMEYIGFEAFRDCHSIESLVISSSVAYVGDGAFYICENVREAEIDTAVVPRMFGYCMSLEKVSFGDSVKSIGYSSFYRCESLVSVKLPDGLIEIDAEAFRCCSSLKELDLGGVESIGRATFRGCESLKTLDLPPSVSSIGSYAFADCIRLKDINAYGSAPEGDDTVFLNDDAVIHCKSENVDSWTSSQFGLEVKGDLGDSRDYYIIFVVIGAILATVGCVVTILILKKL